MEGEEAEKAERCRGHKPADLGGIHGVEIEILDFGADQGALAQGFVKAFFHGAGVNAGKINKMKIEAGLGSGGDDEEGSQCEGKGAIPQKTTDDQQEKEVESVEEFPVVGVLHFPHPAELFHPDFDLRGGCLHPNEFAPSSGPVPVCFMSFSKPHEGGRRHP